MFFLVLVLGASTTVVTEPARTNKAPAVVAVSSSISGVLKDGDGSDNIECMEVLPDGRIRMTMTGDELVPCKVNFASGLVVRLDKGEVITSETEGTVDYGYIRVYASGLPYRLIGDSRHVIEPNAIIDVVVENGFTHTLSKEGRTSVVACDVSEDDSCVKRGFTLLEGDRITLQREGQVYAWENSEGDDLSMEDTGGCSVSKGGRSTPWSMILALGWTLMWLRRRRTSDR